MPPIRALLAFVLLSAAIVGAPAAPASHQAFVPGAGAPDGGPALDPVPPASPTGHLRTWKGIPGDVPGKVVFSEHEILVTDHPYDDRGSDTDGDDGRTLSPGEYYSLLEGANAAEGASGDYVYPNGFGRNGADIVEVRVAADAEAWYMLVIFNTILDPSGTAFQATMGEHLLLVHGGDAVMDGVPVTAVTDADQNTYEVRIPRSAYDPGDEVRDVLVAAGVWDTTLNDWYWPGAVGSGQFYDLAYVPNEGMDSYWRELEQSRDLAANNFAGDAFSVDFGRLVHDPCEDPDISCGSISSPPSKPFTRVFRSGQPLGEGVAPQERWDQDASFPYNLYRSRYQPYAIYVPQKAWGGGPHPLMLLDHFLAGNYMSYPITSWPEMQQWADPLGIIVAMPLGRGEAGWYEAESEKDVFEVWRDVAQHYNIDRERVSIAGMSMGGFGTWRLGHLYPDQFAAAISWSGPMTPYSIAFSPAPVMYPQQNPPACDRDAAGCGYTLTDLFGNASNVPYLVVQGGADELVPSISIETAMGSFAKAGGPYRYVFYPTRRHETSYPGSTAHWVNEFLGGLPKRATAPARVTYRVVRDFDDPAFGLHYDGAYWVDGMELAAGAEDGSIDADRSGASSNTVEIPDRIGLDDLGPYRVRGRDVHPGTTSTSGVSVDALRLARAELDTVRMGWDPAATNFVSATTDGPLRLVLRGAFAPDVPFEVEGGPVTVEREGSNVVLVAQAGTFSVRLGPAE
jgi:dienelactone hydrolase